MGFTVILKKWIKAALFSSSTDRGKPRQTVITSPKGVRFKKKRSFQRESERWKLSSKWYLRMEKNRDIHRKPLKGGHNSIGASSESRAEMERPKEAVIKAIVSFCHREFS